MITVTDFDAPRRPATSAPSRHLLTVSEPPPLTPPDESAESSEASLEEPVPSAAWRHTPQVDTRAAPPSARPMSVYARLYSGVGHRNARCAVCRARAGLEPEPVTSDHEGHIAGHRGHREMHRGHRGRHTGHGERHTCHGERHRSYGERRTGHEERHRGGTVVGLRDRHDYLDLETGGGGHVSLWDELST